MTHSDQPGLSSADSGTLADFEYNYLRTRADFMPWTPRARETEREQVTLQHVLRRHAGATHFGFGCYIAPDAYVMTDYFSIGDRSTIAAGAIVRGDVNIGCGSSINPFAHIAGKVTIGNDVMIAGMVSIYGISHGHELTEIPMSKQESRSRGVVIGDDCWIGANAVIVDGVVIGSHVLIAAGAIVTKSIPDGVVVGGNPARIIKKRGVSRSAPLRMLLPNLGTSA